MQEIKDEIIRELSKHRDRRNQRCLRSYFYFFTDFAVEDIDKAIQELADEGKVLVKKDLTKEVDDIIILLWRKNG